VPPRKATVETDLRAAVAPRGAQAFWSRRIGRLLAISQRYPLGEFTLLFESPDPDVRKPSAAEHLRLADQYDRLIA
jgi:hypothetical protein